MIETLIATAAVGAYLTSRRRRAQQPTEWLSEDEVWQALRAHRRRYEVREFKAEMRAAAARARRELRWELDQLEDREES